MGREFVTFGDNEIEKRKFHHFKNLILLRHVDIDNIQVTKITVTKMMIIKLNRYA